MTCSECHTASYADFHVPEAVWDRVMRPSGWAGGGTICWNCFMSHYDGEVRAEVEQLRRVQRALQSILALHDPCIHEQATEAKAAIERGEWVTLEQLEASLHGATKL